MNKLKKTIVFIALLLTISITLPTAFAQGPGFDEDVEDVPAPFDGGVTLVAVAAAGYGIKKIRDSRKK
ncbi:MAG: hypothetical protein KDC07_00805 [Chitinophagaceae bacterium]|nr:hypothetical protein [Chitinophagaceae bacterium]MCB9044623.1 hypothetical protein [Chitinophagales bacterium]